MIPKISASDFQQINTSLEHKHPEYKNFINDKIKPFDKINEYEVSKNTVRLNSVVEFWHSVLKKVVKIKIVLPSQENLTKRCISIFSPICLALIGRNENDLITIDNHGIDKSFRIIRIANK